MTAYKTLIFFVLIFILSIIAYWPGIEEAISRWLVEANYSHGFLIPLVTLYILWEKRELIKNDKGPPLASGLWLIFFATLLFIIGEIAALYILIQYSFVVVLIGISLIFYGRATKHTIVPILFLLFSVPLPYFLELLLTSKLQLFSSWLGVQFIRLFQIPVFLEGNIIDLGKYKLAVVEACSGLRYLYPLMSLGFIAAYFYQASFYKKAILFLSTIPITILMNSFRIGVIGVLVENWGISMAEGFLHDFEGWIIFMACAVILFLVVILMERVTKGTKSLSVLFGVVNSPKNGRKNLFDNNSNQKIYLYWFALIILIISLVTTRYIDNRVEIKPDRIEFINFPLAINEWNGQHFKLDERVENVLEATDTLYVNFSNEQFSPINLFVAYYESQRQGPSPHSPRVCIPGGGWEITSITREEIDGHHFNRVLITKDGTHQLVYYWFQGRGRIIANEYINKWFVFKDALILNRSDGALVRLVREIEPGEDIQAADENLSKFMFQMQKSLNNFIPE